MADFSFIKTLPNQVDFSLFDELPKSLYEANSHRFKSGNEPVTIFLEGCYVLLKNGVPVGRFAFYENPELIYKNEKACSIGSYECVNDQEISGRLINKAKEIAFNKGYSWIIGPMEGSTWSNYRFSLDHDSAVSFMEPYHHLYYNNQFLYHGFDVIHRYGSNLISPEIYKEKQLKDIESVNQENGFTYRKINLDDYQNELKKIAELSLSGFKENFLFTPISEKEFLNKYIPLKSYLDPNLIWMIEDKNRELQAYIFGIKDFFDPKEETLIIKTIVKKKESDLTKVGVYSVLKINQMAQKFGFKKVVHAFMSRENFSSKESERNQAKPYKEYALYGLKL